MRRPHGRQHRFIRREYGHWRGAVVRGRRRHAARWFALEQPQVLGRLGVMQEEILRGDLMIARADGSLGRVLETIARTDVLLVDDFAMAPLSEQECRDFLEICDDRYNRRSTVLTSQLPVEKWHAQIGDPTVADSILDRLVHAAHRIELQGESMRKKKGGRGGKDAE